jgi:hypothetical protein
MEDLNKLEGIGMDRDFVDMESDVQPVKGPGDMPPKRKPKAKPALTEFEQKVCAMSVTFNSNQIAAMLMIPKAQIEEILNK